MNGARMLSSRKIYLKKKKKEKEKEKGVDAMKLMLHYQKGGEE